MPLHVKTLLAFVVVMAAVMALAWTIRRMRGDGPVADAYDRPREPSRGRNAVAALLFCLAAAGAVWKIGHSIGGQLAPTIAAVALVTLASLVMMRLFPRRG